MTIPSLVPKVGFQTLAYVTPLAILSLHHGDYFPTELPSYIPISATLIATVCFSAIYPAYQSQDILILYEHLIYTIQVFRLLAINEIIPREQSYTRNTGK